MAKNGRAMDRRPVQRIEPAMIAGRVVPHDLDCEAAVLSAMMLHQPSIDEVRDILDEGAKFFSESNGRIFDSISDIHKNGGRVDIVSVASHLRDLDRLHKIGGAAYLAQISDATPAVGNVRQHAQIIFEKWRLRQMIAQCQVTAAHGYSPVADVQALIDEHAAAIHDLATRNAGAPLLRAGGGLMEKLEADWRIAQHGGGLMGIRTGLDTLDNKIAGLHAGDLYVIAARPGMGKTSLACGIAVHVGSPPQETEHLFRPPVVYGVPVFSLEMPREQLQIRLACTEAGVDLGKYRRGYLEGDEWKRVFQAGAFLQQIPLWIDDTTPITVPQIQAKVRQIRSAWERPAWTDADGRAHPEQRVGPVVIDYLQLIKSRTEGRSREEEVAEVSRELKAMAKALKVPVIALAQLNRSVETRPGKDKRPQLSDLRDSGAIEQDADAIIFIYRDEYYNPSTTSARGIAELIIAKQRNGSTGKVLARFDAACTRFGNLSPGDAASYYAEGGSDE